MKEVTTNTNRKKDEKETDAGRPLFGRAAMEKLLMIDGSNLLFQMFFGMPARIVNADGKAIQGTLGFVGALLKMIRSMEPSHVFVVFDGERENERRELDPDYKANRPDYGAAEEENPFSQLPDIYRALEYLGIRYVETTDCEADDFIAGYAAVFGQQMEVVIASFDSDFFQLVTDKVSVLRYRGERTVLCTPEYIKDRFKIVPEQYAEFKALVGDTADNIKGIKNVGPKTAARLLAEFGTLGNIIAQAETIRKESVREAIVREADRLRRNYRIIRLGEYRKLPYDKTELEYRYGGMTTTEVLKGIGLR